MNFPATFTDQMGNEVHLAEPPRRIVSLVPSQTELLYDLGLRDEVVGITKFCVHPQEWFRNKTRVGGTKQIDFGRIAALKPDLIIGNKEENDEDQVRALMQLYPVWMSDIHNLPEAMEMMRKVGELVDKKTEAEQIANEVGKAFKNISGDPLQNKPRTAAYFIWKNPWMVAGTNTFIDANLHLLNLRNVFTQPRYPETTLDELTRLAPEVVLLSSEPYPFAEKHIAEIRSVLPQSQVLLVDGELFSWYGSRMLKAPAYFRQVLSRISDGAGAV